MIDEAAITDSPQPDGAEARLPGLEERVRHLEERVAALQDTSALEERVTERVSARVAPAGGPRPAGSLLEAGRHLLPAAVGAITAAAAAPPAATQAQPTSPPLRPPWLLFDIYAEFRALSRMYLDPRFRLTWAARLAPLVLVPAIATSWIWLPGTSILPNFVSTLVVKVVDLVLAFMLFQVLHREVTRYRATSPDLPPSLRL